MERLVSLPASVPEDQLTRAFVEAARLAGVPGPVVALLEAVAPALLRHLVSLLRDGKPAPLPPVEEAEPPRGREGLDDLLHSPVADTLPPPAFPDREAPTKVEP